MSRLPFKANHSRLDPTLYLAVDKDLRLGRNVLHHMLNYYILLKNDFLQFKLECGTCMRSGVYMITFLLTA